MHAVVGAILIVVLIVMWDRTTLGNAVLGWLGFAVWTVVILALALVFSALCVFIVQTLIGGV